MHTEAFNKSYRRHKTMQHFKDWRDDKALVKELYEDIAQQQLVLAVDRLICYKLNQGYYTADEVNHAWLDEDWEVFLALELYFYSVYDSGDYDDLHNMLDDVTAADWLEQAYMYDHDDEGDLLELIGHFIR